MDLARVEQVGPPQPLDQCAGAGRTLRNLTALGRRRVDARDRWLPRGATPTRSAAARQRRGRRPRPRATSARPSPRRIPDPACRRGSGDRRRSPASSVVRKRRRRRSSPSRRDNSWGSDPGRGRGRACENAHGPAPEPGTCAPGVAPLHAPSGSCATVDRSAKPQDVAAPVDMQAGRCASRERQNVH